MTRLFQQIAIIVFAMILATPAYSKIVHITDYQKDVLEVDVFTKSKGNKCEGVGCIGYKNYECDNTRNEYKEKQHNALCEEFYKFEEKKCYKCYCPNKFEFTEGQCTSTGFAKPNDDAYRCTLGDKNYYSTCNCSSDYLPKKDFVSNVKSNFTFTEQSQTGVKGVAGSGGTSNGTTLTCYNYKSFKCNTGDKDEMVNSKLSIKTQGSGSVTFTHGDDSQYIIYKGNLNTQKGNTLTKDYNVTYSTVCVTGVSSYADPLYAITDTKKDTMTCAKIETKTAPHYPSSSYYYFTGDCWKHDEKTNCIGTETVDCVAIESQNVSVYDKSNDTKGSQSCKKATGCSTGRPTSTNYICVGTYQTQTGMSITKMSAGGFNCGKLTGCASGYTAFGNMSNTAYASAITGRAYGETWTSATDGTKSKYVYESNIKTSKAPPAISESEKVDYLICRKPIGCATGYIDKDGCWSGCAAWFF